MTKHKTGTREEWLAARLELLKAEKELTRRRQQLPWVRIEKECVFNTDEGEQSLRDQEHKGLSAFVLEDGVVYHTYSCHQRGVEEFNVTYQLLDRVPRGRNEDRLPYPRAWIRREDKTGPASV